jgi:hypothetical protein
MGDLRIGRVSIGGERLRALLFFDVTGFSIKY